ncbi:MAG: hypothetical protein JWP00_1424 [Chloroflexi bacterium]|jgi:hypothetical protein|nr:hypothetical protein [Chloroflexota bacterium]
MGNNMENNNVIRATNQNNKVEVILRADGGTLPPLVQPTTPEEQTAYQQAGAALARGSVDEAKQILENAGFTIASNQ